MMRTAGQQGPPECQLASSCWQEWRWLLGCLWATAAMTEHQSVAMAMVLLRRSGPARNNYVPPIPSSPESTTTGSIRTARYPWMYVLNMCTAWGFFDISKVPKHVLAVRSESVALIFSQFVQLHKCTKSATILVQYKAYNCRYVHTRQCEYYGQRQVIIVFVKTYCTETSACRPRTAGPAQYEVGSS